MAAHLRKGVFECQNCVSSHEFAEWYEYYKLDPFGELRDDIRSAQLTAVFANAFRGKGQRAFTPADFMLRFGFDEVEESDPKMLMAKFRHLTLEHNAFIEQKKKRKVKYNGGSDKQSGGSDVSQDKPLRPRHDQITRDRLELL